MSVVCDIDGVIYRGETLIPGSDEALRRVKESSLELYLATNNSTRTPEHVSERVKRIADVEIAPKMIVNSSQAAGHMLTGLGGPVLVMGANAIDQAMAEFSIDVTDNWKNAAAVVIGLDYDLSYERLSTASNAVRSGARFVATNVDPTLPIYGGYLPGAGSMVAAVHAATGVEPEVAGKPHPAMRALLKDRGVESAWVVGDKVDTDIALAAEEDDWQSILVGTGVTPFGTPSPADHAVADLSAAIDLVFEHHGEG